MKNWISIALCGFLMVVGCTQQNSTEGSAESSDSIKVNGFYNPEDFPKIELVIKNSNFKELNQIRKTALLQNDFSNTRQWFKAKVIDQDGNIKARVRLKGDFTRSL